MKKILIFCIVIVFTALNHFSSACTIFTASSSFKEGKLFGFALATLNEALIPFGKTDKS